MSACPACCASSRSTCSMSALPAYVDDGTQWQRGERGTRCTAPVIAVRNVHEHDLHVSGDPEPNRPDAWVVVRQAVVTPRLLAFLAVLRLRRRPAPLSNALQRIDPVHRSPLGLTVLSCHAHVASVLRDPRFGSNEDRNDLEPLGRLQRL